MSLANFKATNHPQQTAKRGASDAVDDRGTDPAFIAKLEERFGKFTLDVAAAEHNAKADRYFTRADDGLAQGWGRPPRWIGPECFMCGGDGQDRTYRIVGEADAAGVVPVSRDVGNGLPCRGCNGHGRQAVHEPDAGERVWCNPPYSDCGAWVRKAWHEWHGGAGFNPALIVMLLPANRVEQGWWQDWVEPFRDRPEASLRVEFLRGRMRFDRPDWTPGPKGDRPPFGCALLIWGGER